MRKRTGAVAAIAGAVIFVAGAPPASAVPMDYSLKWLGTGSWYATATLSGDLPSHGFFLSDTTTLMSSGVITSFDLTIFDPSTSSTFNYSIGDFSYYSWDTGDGGSNTLDLTRELVGQTTASGVWGSMGPDADGDFNFFQADPNVTLPGPFPGGTGRFTFNTGDSSSFALVSFAPVPGAGDAGPARCRARRRGGAAPAARSRARARLTLACPARAPRQQCGDVRGGAHGPENSASTRPAGRKRCAGNRSSRPRPGRARC